PMDKPRTDAPGQPHDMNHRTDVATDTMPTTYTPFAWSTDKDVWWNPAEFSYHFITTTTVNPDPNQPIKRDFGTGVNDRAPVFTEACYKEADPLKCTKFEISEGLAMTMYPDSNLMKSHSGVEYVILTIDEQGKVGGYEVVSQQNRCPGCAQAAVDAVANLMVTEKWYPATRNGQPIRARVAIPVRFSMTTNTNK
ncbi:MAG: energy transducer TonB, partial [Bacteroidota bacterium]